MIDLSYIQPDGTVIAHTCTDHLPKANDTVQLVKPDSDPAKPTVYSNYIITKMGFRYEFPPGSIDPEFIKGNLVTATLEPTDEPEPVEP